jgi:hypothetical protein
MESPSLTEPYKSRKRPSYFLVGWLGIFGGIVIFFFGTVSRHLDRGRQIDVLLTTGKDFLELWDLYGSSRSDMCAFILATGRVVYFVSVVAAIFTYDGPQLWTWVLLSTGGLALLGSGIGAVMKENIAVLSLIMIGLGMVMTVAGIILLKFESNLLIVKALFILAVVMGTVSFPCGLASVMHGSSFEICIIVECLAAVVAVGGFALLFLRLAGPKKSYSD